MTTAFTHLTYDQQAAESMAPLLQGITNEILERSREVRWLRKSLDRLCGPEQELPEHQAERNEALELRSRLATQLRERRAAREELESLGCFFDERSRVVRIPGPSGTLDDGFLWSQTGGHLAAA